MLTLRPATQHDIPTLTDLWLEKMVLVAQADSRIKLLPDAAVRWASDAGKWLGDERCAIFCAEQNGHIVGFIIGWLQSGPPGITPEQFGIVTELALDMHQYQQGAARALLAPLRAWFSERGADAVMVLIPHRHPVQQAFWRSLGAAEWMDLLWIK